MAREATSAVLDSINWLILDGAKAAKARPLTAPYWGEQQSSRSSDLQLKADILALLEAGLGSPIVPSAAG